MNDKTGAASSHDKLLYTIGHSNRTPEELLELLQRHGVTAVADVRSQPYSRYLPDFNRDALKNLLQKSGISYAFMGQELGARRSEPDCYVDGQAKYELVQNLPAFQTGLDRIRTGSAQHRIAMICAEKDPLTCHRSILIARVLQSEFEIQHIVSEDETESHAELEKRLLRHWKLEGQQLFATADELLEEAYKKQAEAIAFTEKETLATDGEQI